MKENNMMTRLQSGQVRPILCLYQKVSSTFW